jgi:hypothetical protein
MDGTTDKIITFCSIPGRGITGALSRIKDFDPSRTGDFRDLFVAKCQECCKMPNMSSEDSENRAVKEHLIAQLQSVFDSPMLVRKLDQQCLQALVSMCIQSLSRGVPSVSMHSASLLFDSVESFCDLAWPMVSIVFTLLRTVIVSTHIHQNLLASQMPFSILAALFRCFVSPEVRERQQVKYTLYEISARLPDRVPILISLISTAFVDSLAGEPIRIGLGEIFELFTSIVQPTPTFTRQSFDSILVQQLLPLHLSSEYPLFSRALASSVLMLLNRDSHRVDDCLLYLWNHFPLASQRKQILFLDEIQGIVVQRWESMSPHSSHVLLERLSVLFSSACVDISEKAIGLVFSDGFRQLLKQYYASIAPILISRATKVSRKHWSGTSAFLAMALVQEIAALDPLHFAKIRPDTRDDRGERRKEIWDGLQSRLLASSAATARSPSARLKMPLVRGKHAVTSRHAFLPVLYPNKR